MFETAIQIDVLNSFKTETSDNADDNPILSKACEVRKVMFSLVTPD